MPKTQKPDVHATLDITDRTCPMTFVVTQLKLEEMQPGEVLEVILSGGEPMQNVPRTLKEPRPRRVAGGALEREVPAVCPTRGGLETLARRVTGCLLTRSIR